MGLYVKRGSPFWWMTLEGTGRRRLSTGIPWQALTAEKRKDLKAQAEAVYHAKMVQLARGRVGLPVDSKATFATFSAWYERHHTAQHKSAPRERVILAHLRAFFGTYRLSEIRPGAWKEYTTDRLTTGVSANTVGRELAVMKTILTAAVGEHLEVSPLAHVKRKTLAVPPKRTLTTAEDTRLLAELTDPEIRDLYIVGVGTLLRQLNLVMLTRPEHRGDRLVVDTKTGQHQVSLTGPTLLQRRAAKTLKARMPSAPTGAFFPIWRARFTKDRDGANAKFLQAFRRACKRANIPWGLKAHGVVWHTATRASGATRMLRDYRVDVRTVQLIGGWKSLDQMAQYLGVDLATPFTQRSPSARTKR